MAQDYSPSLVTKNLVFCGDAAMKSAAGPATLLYDKVNNNNGTMYNGTCLDFDGTDDSVDVPDSSDLDGFSKFTLSGWVNPNVTGGYRVIFDKYFPSGYTWRISNIDYPYIYINGSYLGSSTAVIEGAWNHLVVTYDGTSTSNNVNFYMAGELVDTGTLNTGTVGTNSYVLKIGEDYDGSSSPMDGKLADLRIYDVILSAANVKELYDDSKVIIPTKNDASGGFVAQTNLKGWWPLTEGVGTIAYDGSGNGNDGTLTNMTSADWLTGQTGAPQLVEGYNRPMLFDGSNDYVQVASDGSSTFANQSFTVAGWINVPDATPSADRTLFSYDYTSHVSPYYAIQIRINNADGKMYFGWNDGASYHSIFKASAFTANTWHHYACTFTSGSQKIYIDGVQVASDTRADTITYYNQEVWIGRSNFGGYFKGLMNEVVVYNSALTLAQVQVLAATGPNGGPLPPDPMTVGSGVAEAINAKSSNAVMSTYSYGGTTYKTWTYRTSGTFVVPQNIDVDVVVVGGGGGGGYNVGGGGGAGGLVSESLTAVASTYTVTVGAGGLGRYASMSTPQCTSGGDSSISIASATTAVGGGRAGGYITSWSDGPQSGGSGGGGRHSQAGAAGTAGQGNAGGSGTAYSPSYAGGGGGGAGAVGANAVFSSPTIAAGDGGNGKNDFINSSVAETAALLAAALPTVGGGYLAGGGGGSRQGTGTIGAGGLGGGGKGSYYSTADGESGQVNTGGGGGAEKDGGSGVVIIRYAVPTPVGYWRNDGNVTWTDRSGNGNTGTVTGSPDTLLFKQGYNGSASTSTGRDGQGFPLKYQNNGAVGFNASNSYIDLGSDPSESGRVFSESAFTVSAWVKSANTVPGGGAPDIQNIVGFPSNNVGHFCIYIDGKLGIWSFSGSAWRFSNTPLTSNQWHHVVLVFDGDDGAFYYLDGMADSAELEYGGTASQKACNLRYIGTMNPSRYFNGQIANVQVYNRALTNSEIKQNFATQASRFQVPRSIITDGLVLNLDAGNPGSYPGSGSTWYDVSGNGCDFTLDGSGITYSASNGGIFTLANGGATQSAGAQASTSTTSTVVMWMKTTDVQALFLDQYTVTSSYYLGAYSAGNKEYYGNCGTPDFYMDTVSKGNIYDYFLDGAWHMVEFKNVDLSAGVGWHTIGFNQYSSYTFANGAVGKIMIYNRTLTNAESAQNFRVQRERFGI
jgi:hypothetical protein